MKKVMILLAALAVGAMATAQEVTIKRGKATMSEADYHMLKQKADAYEATKKALDETLASYQKQQQMNDMYRPVELRPSTIPPPMLLERTSTRTGCSRTSASTARPPDSP